MWKKLALVGVAVAIVVAAVVVWRAYRRRPDPSLMRARGSIELIVFLQERVLVRNELSEVFASDDGGRSWHLLPEERMTLAVAEGNQLWGVEGEWRGAHQATRAAVWRSTDRGERWDRREIELPKRPASAAGSQPPLFSEELAERLPLLFVNEPAAAPLLLMGNFQLVRPDVNANVTSWVRVGTPVRDAATREGTLRHRNAGLQVQGSIYLAVSHQIFFSDNDGVSWSSQRTEPFYDARIRCRDGACYALLAPLGSEPATLLTTVAGRNEWKKLVTLDLPAVSPALSGERGGAAVELFGATDLLVTADGLLVAGVVNAGANPWGAVLRVGRDGAVGRVGQSLASGLWVLEQAPDGSVWAGGGDGAYRLEGAQWSSTWAALK